MLGLGLFLFLLFWRLLYVDREELARDWRGVSDKYASYEPGDKVLFRGRAKSLEHDRDLDRTIVIVESGAEIPETTRFLRGDATNRTSVGEWFFLQITLRDFPSEFWEGSADDATLSRYLDWPFYVLTSSPLP